MMKRSIQSERVELNQSHNTKDYRFDKIDPGGGQHIMNTLLYIHMNHQTLGYTQENQHTHEHTQLLAVYYHFLDWIGI
jgi:hypothetical protein